MPKRQRQAFFAKEVKTESAKHESKTPMVNSGCESHFAVFDWRVKKHGGIVPINTISDLHVSFNHYLASEDAKSRFPQSG